MHEGSAKGEEPDEREEDSNTSHDFSVDESAQAPTVDPVHPVEVVSVDSGDDGGKGQLRQAQDHASEVGQDHLGGLRRTGRLSSKCCCYRCPLQIVLARCANCREVYAIRRESVTYISLRYRYVRVKKVRENW